MIASVPMVADHESQGHKERIPLKRPSHRYLLMGGLLFGFALRLLHLGSDSLWYDELVSAFLSGKAIPDLIAHTARDIHPPAYYLLLHFWQSITRPVPGQGLEFLFAWPSLVWGMLLLPLIYALGRRLFDRQIATIALWLAAIHPFHIWYSQEVRMYTLGAFLGLLCLWSLVKWGRGGEEARRRRGEEALVRDARMRGYADAEGRTDPVDALHPSNFTLQTSPFTLHSSNFKLQTSNLPWLLCYVVAAAAGLYTLYYFAFLLVTLNLIFFLNYVLRRADRPSRQLLAWILAQGGVLLLWLPWLPTFWRQISEPPVPPWRGLATPWLVLSETMSALLVGQSPPLQMEWLWAAGAGLLLAGAIVYARQRHWEGLLLLLLYIFVPLLLVYLLSILVTPLYHIRYFFLYAAPVPLLLALGLRMLRQRRLYAIGLSLLFVVSGWSLADFWQDPRYASDDHRGAVANLSAAWRPGDVILVNAGWVYPALEVYWPQELTGPGESLPPAPDQRLRLYDYANTTVDAPLLLVTGSIAGDPSLGWGLPESDFYAISIVEARAAVEHLAQQQPRIWHYRLYDTVSDPHGLLRQELDSLGERRLDLPYPGRDYLRVQLYEMPAAEDPTFCPQAAAANPHFGQALHLIGHDARTTATAGSTLYVTLCWEALAGLHLEGREIHTSLRLYRYASTREELAAQADAAPLVPTSAWEIGGTYRQPLSLPLPASLPPGIYSLEIIAYTADDGAPLEPDQAAAIHGQRWQLAEVTVALPQEPPPATAPLARFDYIELASARVGRQVAAPGETVDLSLLWRPRPNSYRDTYNAVFTLEGAGEVQRWESLLGGDDYPSGEWPPAYPVRTWESLVLAPDLPPGEYRLSVHLERTSDGLSIPARVGWWQRPTFEIGRVAITR
jgi:mannosyltransferase